MLEWNESLNVNIEEIDAQHMWLVKMINDIYTLMVSGRCRAEGVELIVADMRAYSVNHFATEERLMEEYKYPYAPIHIANHTEFVQKANEAEGAAACGDSRACMDLLNFLSDWLVNHINVTDRQLGDFLQQAMPDGNR